MKIENKDIADFGNAKDGWYFEKPYKMHEFITNQLRIFQKENKCAPKKISMEYGIDVDNYLSIDNEILGITIDKNIRWDMDATKFNLEIK